MRATLLRSSSRGRPKVDTRPEIGAPLRAYLKSEFARVLGAGARNQHAFGGTQDTGLSSSVEGFLPPVAGAAPREPRDGRKTEEGGVAGTTVHASEGGRAPTANSNHHSPAGGSGRLNASARAGSFGPDSPGDMSPSLTPTPGRARAHAKDRDFLICEEVCKLNPPHDMPVRFSHIAVLFAIDTDHDGRFSMAELEEFMSLCVGIRTRSKPHEFETLLQGQCVALLLQLIRTGPGVAKVVDWVMRMLADSYPHIDAGPERVPCMHIDAVFVAYNVLCGGTLSALDFTPSQLLDLLHLAAEEQGLLDLDDGDLDDVVPVEVLRSFVHHFVLSVAEVYKPMGLAMPGLMGPTKR